MRRFVGYGFCLLCAIALLAGCGEKRDESEDTSKDKSDPPKTSATLDLLPGDGEVDGWSLTGPGELYVGEALYDPIDGAADKYFQFRFKEAAFATYEKGEALAEVQVYLMGSPDDACGIYSVYDDVNAEHAFIAVPSPDASEAAGPRARVGEGNYEFAAGSYFVRVLSHASGPGSIGSAALAAQVAAAVSTPHPTEPRVSAFLPAGSQGGGTKYFRTAATLADVFYIAEENVLELSVETFGVSACYDVKTTEAGTKVGVNALFVIEYPSDAAALTAFTSALAFFEKAPYRSFGVPEGHEPQLIVQKGDEDFMRLRRTRNVLYGAWMIEDTARMEELVRQLAEKVRQRAAGRKDQ